MTRDPGESTASHVPYGWTVFLAIDPTQHDPTLPLANGLTQAIEHALREHAWPAGVSVRGVMLPKRYGSPEPQGTYPRGGTRGVVGGVAR